ncbi:MAG: hypothetical protein QNJ41_10100 [Xenococcaceae cyanobacterium MO_188.B32]|nr:hypothetical protein [Xenococcaceae cyanobacterium MO_188.B32]
MLVNSFFCHFGSKARQKSSTSLQIIQGQGKNTTDTLIDFRPATVIILNNVNAENISESNFMNFFPFK